MSYEPVFELIRGSVAESLHHGAVAVADPQGVLLAWWGDPRVVTFLRSSGKPMQALALVESGAAARFGLSPKQLAVVCASHVGTDDHVQTVRSIQERAGFSENDLVCGIPEEIDPQTAKEMTERGEAMSFNRHNCSGKHSGMLTLATHLGLPREGYTHPEHPVQRMVLETVAAMCDLEPDQVLLGTDGCSAPTFAMPLVAGATAFARLADPEGLPPAREAACREIVGAMTSHPDMVAGTGKLDTRLMEVFEGRLVAKGGAEGYQGIGLLPGAVGPDSGALGLAIKIADGNLGKRARGPVVLAVLDMLGALAPGRRAALEEFLPQDRTNDRGLIIGRGRVSFELCWGAGESGGE